MAKEGNSRARMTNDEIEEELLDFQFEQVEKIPRNKYFHHPEPNRRRVSSAHVAVDANGKQVCRFFMEHGKCRFGDKCRFSHDDVICATPGLIFDSCLKKDKKIVSFVEKVEEFPRPFHGAFDQRAPSCRGQWTRCQNIRVPRMSSPSYIATPGRLRYV